MPPPPALRAAGQPHPDPEVEAQAVLLASHESRAVCLAALALSPRPESWGRTQAVLQRAAELATR